LKVGIDRHKSFLLFDTIPFVATHTHFEIMSTQTTSSNKEYGSSQAVLKEKMQITPKIWLYLLKWEILLVLLGRNQSDRLSDFYEICEKWSLSLYDSVHMGQK
jgi:hypothetical protein